MGLFRKNSAEPASGMQAVTKVSSAVLQKVKSKEQYPTGIRLVLIMIGIMCSAFLTALDISVLGTVSILPALRGPQKPKY
jgi:hypothetical protein